MFGKISRLLVFFKKLLTPLFFRYLLIGVVGNILELGVLLFCVHIFKVWYLYSNFFASTISLCFTFLFNNFWTFSCKKITIRKVVLLLCTHLLNMGIFSTILFFLTSIGHINYLISKAIIKISSIIWNFFIARRIIFK